MDGDSSSTPEDYDIEEEFRQYLGDGVGGGAITVLGWPEEGPDRFNPDSPNFQPPPRGSVAEEYVTALRAQQAKAKARAAASSGKHEGPPCETRPRWLPDGPNSRRQLPQRPRQQQQQ